MSHEDWIAELKKCMDMDAEEGHVYADAVLCSLLIDLGYRDVVDAWVEIDKWYA